MACPEVLEGEGVPALSVGRTLSEVEGYSVGQQLMKPEKRGQAFRSIFFQRTLSEVEM